MRVCPPPVAGPHLRWPLASRIIAGPSTNCCRFMCHHRAGRHPSNVGVPRMRSNALLSGGAGTTVRCGATLRSNARRTWQHGKGARNVHSTAIRRALSPSHPGERVTVGVHGCPRGGAPIRPHSASRVIPGPHTGGETTQSLHIPRDAMPARVSSFRLLAMASPQLDARWKLLI